MVVERVRPILLVEDEGDDVAFVMRALERSGIANPVVVTTSVGEARKKLEKADSNTYPALAVVDVYLPGRESGLDFLAWLRRQPGQLSGIPVMIYSVSDRPEHHAEARSLGSVVFLRKPVVEEALSTAIQALGFVVTTTVAADRVQRIIEPRYSSSSTGR